jgi:hypothetical protein
MEFRKIEPGVWKAEKEGDEIIGKLVKIGESSKYGKGKVYHLEVENPQTGAIENKVVFGSTVLDDRMGFVEVGQYVKIAFTETTTNKKGQDVKVYEVSVGTPDEE